MAEQPFMSWMDFQRSVDTFKTNFVKFRVSGNPANKQAYEVSQKAIDDTLKNLRTNISTNGDNMDMFKDTYSENLQRLHEQSQKIQKKGPEIQDKYFAEKKRAEKEDDVDFTPLIVKATMVAVLMGMAVFLPPLVSPIPSIE